MGELVYCCLLPHPPVIVPEVGGRDLTAVSATVEGMKKASKALVDTTPDTVLIISPHGPVFRDAVAYLKGQKLSGSLKDFRAPQVEFSFVNDLELIACIEEEAQAIGIPMVGIDGSSSRWYGVDAVLDHGMMVPLYYLRRAGLPTQVRLVALGMSLLGREQLYRFGVGLRKAIANSPRRVALVASGDMSHRLIPGAPAGYDPKGEEFDRIIREALQKGDPLPVLKVESHLAERAGECGLRSLIMALGALDGLAIKPRVYSYEGPFGVGYLVAELLPQGPDASRSFLPMLLASQAESVADIRAHESPIVRLARQSLEHYVNFGSKIAASQVPKLPDEFYKRAGAFVSIHTVDGQLRGCIGTVGPTQKHVVEEVIENAISAGTRDPRFPPVRAEELPYLVYSVDVLEPPEKVFSTDQLDPKRYGIIVRSGLRSGLLLPDLEGVDTVEEQIAIAKRKAGIGEDEPCELERFEVRRYH